MAEAAPVIIKRVKKGAHGHHGGAWKVAYADFVTAMMAFFLLLWLLNAVTEEQLQGIADYFAPTALSKSTSGAGGILGGKTVGEGAMASATSAPSVSLALPPPTISPDGKDQLETLEELDNPMEGTTEKEFLKAMAEREEQQFDKAKDALEKAIAGIPELKKFADSLLVDNTPEGLRIQIVDQDGLAMFPSGSAAMFGHTRSMLDLVSRVVMQMPQRISISGHTDAIPFVRDTGYGNWELSADRALSTRRVLAMSGVPPERVDRVVGKADTDPFEPNDPKGPRNRRISIVLLRENLPPTTLAVPADAAAALPAAPAAIPTAPPPINIVPQLAPAGVRR
ncbi:MAG: OmpA family protein [Alphaproteobacteria bacterium]|nr:OmpA family protein [Alphaproteobacteria bacterium]